MRIARCLPGPARRAGIAMATALGGLVIIGVMIAGVFFTSNQELRVGTNIFVQERAFRAAEFGINAALASWNNAEMLLMPIGGEKKIVYDSSAKGWRDTVTITRLNSTGYLIGSTGTAFGGIQGTSRRRTALFVRLSAPKFEVDAALVSRFKTTLTNTPIVAGINAALGWPACPPADTAAAIAVSDTSQVALGKSCVSAGNCLVGAPAVMESDAAADTATYFDFGDESWATLTSYQPKTYSVTNKPPSSPGPVVAAGVCDKSDPGNWGDPTRSTPAGPCESYFPIIHAQGSGRVQLSGGSGQGILLVDGDLAISKTFAFHGPVIVRGTFESKDDAKVHGTVMAANTAGSGNTIGGRSAISYSSCSIKAAFDHAVPPKRVAERAWTEVF